MKDLLIPAYQPIYDLTGKRIAHYEALARIRGDKSNLAHVTLLQLAEEHGFIDAIDLAMTEKVLRHAMQHDHTVAVNISPYTIESGAEKLLDVLRRNKSIMHRLIIEVTECTPITNLSTLMEFFNAVRDLGGRIAVDDYGHIDGNFTEELVNALKPDLLKLDGAVLKRAVFLGDNSELERACAVGASLSVELVAEFVDTMEKITLLKTLGIRYAQGRCFGMPDFALPSAKPANQHTSSSGAEVLYSL